MKPVDVFGWKHRFQDLLVVNVVGEGELNNEAVDVRIVVELTHDAQQVGLGD